MKLSEEFKVVAAHIFLTISKIQIQIQNPPHQIEERERERV